MTSAPRERPRTVDKTKIRQDLLINSLDDSLKHGMPALRNKLMTEVHKGLTAMHLGSNRSEYEIRRHAYWPRIRNNIHAFLAACTKCQQNKINRRAPQGLLQSLAIPRRPGTHYALDFVTHLPYSSREEYDALLVIVDRFSKRVWLIPTWGTATAEVTAMLFLKHIIYENGIAPELRRQWPESDLVSLMSCQFVVV